MYRADILAKAVIKFPIAVNTSAKTHAYHYTLIAYNVDLYWCGMAYLAKCRICKDTITIPDMGPCTDLEYVPSAGI